MTTNGYNPRFPPMDVKLNVVRQVRLGISKMNPRSTWDKAVCLYARELLKNYQKALNWEIQSMREGKSPSRFSEYTEANISYHMINGYSTEDYAFFDTLKENQIPKRLMTPYEQMSFRVRLAKHKAEGNQSAYDKMIEDLYYEQEKAVIQARAMVLELFKMHYPRLPKGERATKQA